MGFLHIGGSLPIAGGDYQSWVRSAIILIIVLRFTAHFEIGQNPHSRVEKTPDRSPVQAGRSDQVRPRCSFSLQNLPERLRGLPALLIADVGITHRGADVFRAQELLDLPQILSHVVKEDRRR